MRDMRQKRVRISVSGRVQGVFFRATAKRIAGVHGLVGYAKNLPDGRVEIVAEGSEPGLRALVDWCYRGSLLAHTTALSYEWESATGEFTEFEIMRDGSLLKDQFHALTNLGNRALRRADREIAETFLNPPKHIVIIPDGNRRWAEERGLQPWEGYQQGAQRIRELSKVVEQAGIECVTFWGFSTDNWSRSPEQVDWLMKSFARELEDLRGRLVKSKVAFRHLGRKDRLDANLLGVLARLEDETRRFTGKTVAIALDYGGRDELVRALRKAVGSDGVTEADVTEALDTAGMPDPDLIIRTSGEQRLSGMMPWQGVHAELYFTALHFPDFTTQQLSFALADYANRQRRFGA